jgi:hypothetical protein
VGEATEMEDGIWNVTRRTVPKTVVTLLGVTVTVGPAPGVAGCNVRETLPGGIVPLGKLLPVTLITVTPGCPALGDVGELSVTVVLAQRKGGAGRMRSKLSRRDRPPRATFMPSTPSPQGLPRDRPADYPIDSKKLFAQRPARFIARLPFMI